ncbi:MAG TPA: GH116 family glycosyl hydrolase [Candidatus Hydrogenedentes bacterium]|nr:GH116 family glycosyl hydrolase [Candidatus Hydrogenedentota bacterium]
MTRLSFLRTFGLTLLVCISCMTACWGQNGDPANAQTFEYASRYYKIQVTNVAPFIRYFSVDSLGAGKLDHNPIQWKPAKDTSMYVLRKVSDTEVEILGKDASGAADWVFTFDEKQFTVTSKYRNGDAGSGVDFRFAKQENHATLLGLMADRNITQLPAVLHLPDMGSFQLRSDPPDATVHYTASRKKGENYISVVLPPASAPQGNVRYTFTAVDIYPKFDGVDQEHLAGFRRNYINLFQVNPMLRVLANNSCSDAVAFTLFLSSMLALKTPPLVDSLTALDLIQMSIERYLNGMKGYGLVGYTNSYEGTVAAGWPSPVDSLDSNPSLVITACNYIKGSNDLQWASRYYPQIKAWMDAQMARDLDHNGLVEYELSGNSGSWDDVLRPANWWDTIGFGHEDAFSNALTYEALNLIVMAAERLDKKDDADHYRQLAEKMKSVYFTTFYNPATGILAGWKSKDGKLHDYYFVFVNSMAVYYNLVPDDKINGIMTVFWNKMREVGFTDFTLGIPGNLVSVRNEDYTHHEPRFGGGKKEDGSDAFQRYENGGASINWSYFTLKAFKKAGLEEPLKQITKGILKGIDAGDFQGTCTNGMTKDWRTWSGECWGYEGYLCDGYLALLALNPEDQ